MDLVNYNEKIFNDIYLAFSKFLKEIKLKPRHFIPTSARGGANIASISDKMPWYKGLSVLDSFDDFKKTPPNDERELRFPVQDIYKFTAEGDDRRIFAGRVESGTAKVGDEVIFLPSLKRSRILDIEGFNLPKQNDVSAGQSAGFILDTQIYIKPGELMCRSDDKLPHVSNKFKANIFWMGKQPFVKGKNYKLKLTTQQVPVVLSEIISVLDASELSSISNKPQVDRHDVAECVLETLKPISFDDVTFLSQTGRFVLVDNYEISGGGIIISPVFDESSSLKDHIKDREQHWEQSDITPSKRANKYDHKPALVVISGQVNTGKVMIAKALEKALFESGKKSYFLGLSNEFLSGGSDSNDRTLRKVQNIQQMGELAHVLTDAGLILITSVSDIDEYELKMLITLNSPNKTIVVNVGENQFSEDLVDLMVRADNSIESSSKSIFDLVLKEIHLNK